MSMKLYITNFDNVFPAQYSFGEDTFTDSRHILRAIGGVNTEETPEMYVFDAHYTGRNMDIVAAFIGDGVQKSELCGELEYQIRRFLTADTTEGKIDSLLDALLKAGALQLKGSAVLDVSALNLSSLYLVSAGV